MMRCYGIFSKGSEIIIFSLNFTVNFYTICDWAPLTSAFVTPFGCT